MNVSDLQTLLNAKTLTPDITEDPCVTCGYTCDLLSWVMAHGETGMAWITVQTHMNVVAVAVLAEMACVILPEDIQMDQENLKKATDEGLHVLSTPLTAFEAAGRMMQAGIKAK